MKILQTQAQIKSMSVGFYDLCYTVLKNRDDKEIVTISYEIFENDCVNFDDFITPNHCVEKKNHNEIIK